LENGKSHPPTLNKSSSPKFLRWAGSKSRLVPKLRKMIPEHDRYIEPFCGSCALFFELKPRSAILSDVNPLLITTLQAVKSNPDEIYRRIIDFDWSSEGYYKLRSTALLSNSQIDTAAEFIFLNANCFNGIFRLNRAGKFNVPYGAERAGKCPSLARLQAASQILQNATIYEGEFEQVVLGMSRPGDFVYMDPPFAMRNKRIFYQYRYDDFGLSDIERLKNLMSLMHDRGVKFIVSYASSDEADYLKNGWNHEEVERLGNIAGFSDKRKTAFEVIITNVE